MYRQAGLEGNGVVFRFSESNIKDEAFLDYINNILMGGMVSQATIHSREYRWSGKIAASTVANNTCLLTYDNF